MASENGKFKVGDRVKYVGKHKSYCAEEHIGKVGTVTKTGVVGLPSVEFDDGTHQVGCYHDNLELVPAWQPKVGDRVLVIDNLTPSGEPISKYTVGEQYEVTGLCKDTNFKDGVYLLNHYQYLRRDQYEQAPAAATLTLEAGKFYQARDGRKVGPMGRFDEDSWSAKSEGMLWIDSGERDFEKDRGGSTDLVALWEEPASNDNAAVAKPKFKVGDRVRTDGGFSFDPTTGSVKSFDAGNDLYQVAVDGDDITWSYLENELTPTTPAIVALIENGSPRPSTAPKVHTSQESATTEAERLAIENPGQKFGVFVLVDSKIADLVTTQTAVLRAA